MHENESSSVLNDLLDAMDSIPEQESLNDQALATEPEDDEVIELEGAFDFDGFQVVRREFFAHVHEPSVTFNNCRFYPNTACINRFPNVDHVLVMVNKNSKVLALKPCQAETRDSFNWCSASKGKRKPKQITCKLFTAILFNMMDWNPDHRYKILGKTIHANGEYLIAFDLTATEVYQRIGVNGKKAKTAKVPSFPEEWQGQFGLPYNEHQKSMQINILDGYAVYSIADVTGAAREEIDHSLTNGG